jgi:hypothetical protein
LSVADLTPVAAAAKDVLILPGDSPAGDRWLWEHARRVTHLAQMLALVPEVQESCAAVPDRTAVAVAALFADAGWALEVREQKVSPWEVLSRPTTEVQRELAVGVLEERAAALLPSETLALACQILRECNDRSSDLPEGQVLREAENLDEIGVMYVLRQFRRWQHQPEGRGLEDLVARWEQLRSYSFWDTAINLGLRWEASRRIARDRLKAVAQFMSALARQRQAADLNDLLRNAKADTSSVFVPPS